MFKVLLLDNVMKENNDNNLTKETVSNNANSVQNQGISENLKEALESVKKTRFKYQVLNSQGAKVNGYIDAYNKDEVEVGWGKYYGPMVEHGTEKMDANPHVYPLWDKNKEKYYKTMLTKLGLQTW